MQKCTQCLLKGKYFDTGLCFSRSAGLSPATEGSCTAEISGISWVTGKDGWLDMSEVWTAGISWDPEEGGTREVRLSADKAGWVCGCGCCTIWVCCWVIWKPPVLGLRLKVGGADGFPERGSPIDVLVEWAGDGWLGWGDVLKLPVPSGPIEEVRGGLWTAANGSLDCGLEGGREQGSGDWKRGVAGDWTE